MIRKEGRDNKKERICNRRLLSLNTPNSFLSSFSSSFSILPLHNNLFLDVSLSLCLSLLLLLLIFIYVVAPVEALYLLFIFIITGDFISSSHLFFLCVKTFICSFNETSHNMEHFSHTFCFLKKIITHPRPTIHFPSSKYHKTKKKVQLPPIILHNLSLYECFLLFFFPSPTLITHLPIPPQIHPSNLTRTIG